jgi:hypothetical protein
MTNKNANSKNNLEVWIGIVMVFLFGIAFLVRTGGYSLKQRQYIKFIDSPYKEIVGTLAVVFSIAWAIFTIRNSRNKK